MTELDGSLTIDEDTFNSTLKKIPIILRAITTSRVTTDTSLVSGSMSGTNYNPGTYAFEIDSSTGEGTIDTDIIMTASGSSYVATTGDVSGTVSYQLKLGQVLPIFMLDGRWRNTLQLFASEMLASGGEIEDKIDSLNEDVASYDEQLVSIATKMESIRARYVAQYAAMDTIVAQLKSTETTITNMMESWKASLK